MNTRYKFLRKGSMSEDGNMVWRKNKWYKHYKHGEDIEMCKCGFHCSKGIWQAFSHVQGEVLARVEVRDKLQEQDNKEVWREMRVIKRWRWTKKDSVMFAVYAARLCLENFESEYPNDKRPRKAIEAAEKWLKNPTKANEEAVRSARTAWSAWSAWSAAWSAALSAWSAASSASSAAGSAAWSARTASSAVRSARTAAGYAARYATNKKLDAWMLQHLKHLKEI